VFDFSDPDAASTSLPQAWRRRLRAVWRSVGWPCRDTVELELLAAGLLERLLDDEGRETVRLSDAGVRALAGAVAVRRRAQGAHEALVMHVARAMQRDGRLVWCGLGLRANCACELSFLPHILERDSPETDVGSVGLFDIDPHPDAHTAHAAPRGDCPVAAQAVPQWVMAVPDVYSIRQTTREAWVEPVVHEIKVSRADLLSDLRQPRKGAAYLALSSQCWYVLAEGIGRADEIPPAFGVMVASAQTDVGEAAGDASFDGELQVLRPAPRRAHRIDFATWMALARATPEPAMDSESPPQSGFGCPA
jgi:hypothetical protein